MCIFSINKTLSKVIIINIKDIVNEKKNNNTNFNEVSSLSKEFMIED